MKNPWKRYSKINPQRDDGNRQICNTVFHALISAGFTGAEYKIILAVIDKTWGFKKNDDSISINQFAQMTNLSERTVQRTLKRLHQLRVVYLSPFGRRAATGSPLNKYSFNKHYDTWRVEGCQIMQGCQVDHPPKAAKGDIQGCERVTSGPPTKETNTKETNTKETKDICPQQSILDLYHELLPEFIHHNDWHATRQKALAARWKAAVTSPNGETNSSQIEFWSKLFIYIRNCDFLMGKIPPSDGHKQFRGSLEFIVKQSTFTKIVEGFYENK